jgi:hypothetical protein
MLIPMHVKASYHTCKHNRFPEDGPSSSKHVEGNKNLKIKILIQKDEFYWFILYNFI